MRRLIVASAAVIFALPLLALPVDAHERRTVGHYTWEVGWSDEPALSNQLNAVSLEVTDNDNDSKPVEGLEDSLKVDVLFGGLTRPLTLSFRAIEGEPGTYHADLIPTKDGSYTFRIYGSIGSQQVDERFESGPNRFDDVTKPTALQYPDAVPNGSELVDRLSALQTSVDQVRILTLVALVVGAVAVAFTAWRRGRD